MGTSGLGTLLVEEGLLTEKDRRTIRGSCGHEGAAFAKSVVALGLLNEDELAAFLAERTPHRIAAKDITKESSSDALGAIDRPLLERLEVVPLKLEGQTLTVAMADPLDLDTMRQLEFFTGYKIKPVIATFSQIRTGLVKLVKEFKPATSHLEDFIANHAIAATKRLATLEGSKEGSKAGSKKKPNNKRQTPQAAPGHSATSTAPAKPQPPRATTQAPAPAGNDNNDGLEYPGEDSELSTMSNDVVMNDDTAISVDMSDDASTSGNVVMTSDLADPDLPLDGDDTDFGDTGLDVDDVPAAVLSTAPDSSKNADKALENLDGLEALESAGDLDSLDSLDSLDGLDSLSDPTLESDGASSDTTPKPAAASADTDDLMGLIGPDDTEAAPATAATAPESIDDLAHELTDELSDKLSAEAKDDKGDKDDLMLSELGDDDINNELSADLGDDLDSGLDGEIDGEIADNMDGDLGSGLGGELGSDMGDDLDSVTPAVTASKSLDDIPGDISEDIPGDIFANDPLAGDDAFGTANDFNDDDLDGTATSASKSSSEVDELLATTTAVVPAPAATDGTDIPDGDSDMMQIVASINRALFKITMAKDGQTAAAQAAIAFGAAGLTTGVLMKLTGQTLTIAGGWQTDQAGDVTYSDKDQDQFKSQGVLAAVARLGDNWQPLDTVGRELDLKPFAAWMTVGKTLMGATVAGKTNEQKFSLVGAWNQTTSTDTAVQASTMELLKQLGRRI